MVGLYRGMGSLVATVAACNAVLFASRGTANKVLSDRRGGNKHHSVIKSHNEQTNDTVVALVAGHAIANPFHWSSGELSVLAASACRSANV
jgi:hypothetical protein